MRRKPGKKNLHGGRVKGLGCCSLLMNVSSMKKR